ncbi:hypothetical protein KUTeg_004493, partial [Tegillarca granosa]
QRQQQSRGTDDDGKHGAAFTILKALRQNNINNVIVVVSRNFGQKLGPRRFNHISNAAKLAVQKVVQRQQQSRGTDDDGKHGAAFTILKALRQNNINNVIVVVSRNFGQKLGPRRFNHISNAAKLAVQKVV